MMAMSYYHGGDIISYAVHAVIWDLIRETVHAATRGLGLPLLIGVTVFAVWIVWMFSRRRA